MFAHVSGHSLVIKAAVSTFIWTITGAETMCLEPGSQAASWSFIKENL